EMLREWLPYQTEYLRSIYASSVPPTTTADGSYQCMECHGSGGRWKCTGCLGSPVYCTSCCLDRHSRDPFHRIEVWDTKGCWTSSWLRDVGVCVELGHHGGWCPVPSGRPPADIHDILDDDDDDEEVDDTEDTWEDEERNGGAGDDPLRAADSPPKPPHAMMTIVDTSGVHFLPVRWCGCPSRQGWKAQLLAAGLFPASQRAPKSCFTFRVLDDYLMTNVECNTNAMNYYRRLRRLTNPAFPHLVPDRYLEFMRVTREWALLQAKKTFGFGPEGRGTPGDGDLGYFCVACPQPGINIDGQWQEDPKTYLYARSYVMDGNFSAEQMKMRRPANDVPMMPGKMFLVNDGPYQEHLKVAKDIKMRSTCNDHKAVSQANADRHKLAVTGIGATACSRHGCFVPHSVVNFQKGERQMNMDYSLSNAMKYRAHEKQPVVVLYDIMCQYGVHIRKRFTDSPHISMPHDLTLWKGIGLFHVHGHQDTCEVRYSPTFMAGAGNVDGEILETMWASLNRISGTTRSMSSSNRQETLDRHMNDWNYKKMITMVALLRRRIQANRPLLLKMREALDAQESGISTDVLVQWRRVLRGAQEQRLQDVRAMDIFMIPEQTAPSKASLQLRLTTAEGNDGTPIGTADWLADGLKIEEAQIFLWQDTMRHGTNATSATRIKLAKHRKALEKSIARFNSRANRIARAFNWDVIRHETPEDEWRTLRGPFAPDASEHVVLNLPSNASPEMMTNDRSLRRLARRERTLRRGQANDALHRLRVLLSEKSFHFRHRIRPSRGSQQRKTRAYAGLEKITREIQRYGAVYRSARSALVRLNMSREARRIYKRLRPADLKVSTAIAEPNARGQRHATLPWIWTVNVQQDMDDDEHMLFVHRVHWFRARSRLDRAMEESAILKRELQSTKLYFDYEQDRWLAMATTGPGEAWPGYAEHCRQTANTYASLAADAQSSYTELYVEQNPLE
ncbi:uncharacterized protein C8Q71DRAFT_700843, partial [Rhodofomes roseus]